MWPKPNRNDIRLSTNARITLEKIQQIYPGIAGHIDHVEVLPPFWHRDTLGKYKAGVYGLHHDVARYDDPKLIAR